MAENIYKKLNCKVYENSKSIALSVMYVAPSFEIVGVYTDNAVLVVGGLITSLISLGYYVGTKFAEGNFSGVSEAVSDLEIIVD